MFNLNLIDKIRISELNLTDKYLKVKEFISEYYWIAGIPFFIFAIIGVMESKEDIKQNKTLTYGMVYGSTSIYKKYSKRNYKYEFYNNGKKYTGTSTAYSSKNIRNGNFYKVEFSDKNPEHSRMIFESEYERKIGTNKKDKVTDTIFVLKGGKFKNEMKDLIEKYEFKTDSIKN
ncbi:hypothetical protein [Mariniflexile sp. AS56]|uniref:hypothetical protein n=1 Tax=Mariniflexile sp. AS56 TaxID=3063957 RepID=UPI0026E94F2D|nr:hypothetical protein [Mariniflexile sp. AS56]MDO7171909.1 hypothetical protein [Mariniflexile sp. AS56]